MQNSVQFHAIELELLPQEFWEKHNRRACYLAICIEIASLLFQMIYILYINFCAILSTRNRDQYSLKISEK